MSTLARNGTDTHMVTMTATANLALGEAIGQRRAAIETESNPTGPASQRRSYAIMKWVTRAHPKTDRIACPWLIRRFIDPDAEILYVPPEDVLAVAERDGALSFDAPGARYTHRDGLCSFEVLVEEYGIDDPPVRLMARIVHGADVAEDRDATPESPGLYAIAEGFALLDLADERQLELEMPVYDALHAWCQDQLVSRDGR